MEKMSTKTRLKHFGKLVLLLVAVVAIVFIVVAAARAAMYVRAARANGLGPTFRQAFAHYLRHPLDGTTALQAVHQTLVRPEVMANVVPLSQTGA